MVTLSMKNGMNKLFHKWKMMLCTTPEAKTMRIDVKCYAAPYENTTTTLDKAIDLAYSLSEEYQCDVDLRYNETGIIFQTISNY